MFSTIELPRPKFSRSPSPLSKRMRAADLSSVKAVCSSPRIAPEKVGRPKLVAKKASAATTTWALDEMEPLLPQELEVPEPPEMAASPRNAPCARRQLAKLQLLNNLRAVKHAGLSHVFGAVAMAPLRDAIETDCQSMFARGMQVSEAQWQERTEAMRVLAMHVPVLQAEIKRLQQVHSAVQREYTDLLVTTSTDWACLQQPLQADTATAPVPTLLEDIEAGFIGEQDMDTLTAELLAMLEDGE